MLELRWLLRVFCCCSAFVAAAEGMEAENAPISNDYVMRGWEISDGLPGNGISGIARTPDGYLWVGTDNGLTRFDGVRFSVLPAGPASGLLSDQIASVLVSKQGDLWVGDRRGGVSRRTNGRFETLIPLTPYDAPPGPATAFAQDAEGSIWIGNTDGVDFLRWKDGKFTRFSSKSEGLPGFAPMVHSSRKGTIWVSTTLGYGRFEESKFVPIWSEEKSNICVGPGRDGSMWAFGGDYLMHYDDLGVEKSRVLIRGIVPRALYEDRDGVLWIGTRNGGLFIFRQGSFECVPTTHGAISCITGDDEGNIWVGTEGGGLNRLRHRAFTLRERAQGLSKDSAMSVSEDTEGRLWATERYGFPYRAVDRTNRKFAVPEGWTAGHAVALCRDPAGGMWLATIRHGLLHWRDGVTTRTSVRDPVTSILVSRARDVWVATIRGPLICLRHGEDIHLPTDGGLTQARALAEDAAGNLWVGTEAGLVFQRQGSEFVRVPLPGAQPNQPIRFIVPDGPDAVWIGAHQGGLYRWSHGKTKRINISTNISTNNLRALVVSSDDNLWLGTSQRIIRVLRSEVRAVVEGHKSSLFASSYGPEDGLPNVEVANGFQNSATTTWDGRVWFGTYRGIVEIRPGAVGEPDPLLPVVVEEVTLDGNPIEGLDRLPLKMPPHPGLLRIRYTVPRLTRPQDIEFRYRLVGVKGSWVQAGRQREATFAGLPPGDYRFEVMANDSNGLWRSKAATLSFSVQAAWWESLWFKMSAALGIALALSGGVRFLVKRRLQTRMRALEQEHAIEKERTRLARDLHDQMGANLTQIALLAEISTSPEAHDQLARSARQAVDALDSIVWAANPRNDTLSSLLQYLARFAEDFLRSTPMRCRIDFPVEVPTRYLPPEFRHHVFLVVKEAFNNAVKYSEAGEVKLAAVFNEEALVVTIIDNGTGFELLAPQNHAGNGLENLRHRAAALNGSCKIESSPENGTCITLSVPWPHSDPVKP